VKLADVEDNMQKSVDATVRSFNTVRTGRANPSILDRISIDYYGASTPLKSLANITIPDSSTIVIQPFDRGAVALIEKALQLSDVGMTPNNDGSVIRLNVPPLTSERRKEFVKLAAKYAEEGKVAVRNVRRDAVDLIRKEEKNSEVSKDESRDLQEKVQKLTDKYIANIEALLAAKEKEILTV
jgi:ribosome recycling factor